ncbi:hypothetical protein UF30_24170, partial [Vibrio parahaemolyticus]
VLSVFVPAGTVKEHGKAGRKRQMFKRDSEKIPERKKDTAGNSQYGKPAWACSALYAAAPNSFPTKLSAQANTKITATAIMFDMPLRYTRIPSESVLRPENAISAIRVKAAKKYAEESAALNVEPATF